MKMKVIVLLTALLLIGGHAFAANGDLTVNGVLSAGTVSVGAGGVKFSDGSVQATGYKGPSTQSVVTSSRVWNTVYRNDKVPALPMMVVISGQGGGSSNTTAYSDSSTSPTTVVAQYGAVWGYGPNMSMSFWVLPGNYYKVVSSCSLGTWVEYR